MHQPHARKLEASYDTLRYVIASFALGLLGGCGSAPQSGPSVTQFPSASTASGSAVRQYDRDGDGRLSNEELSSSPGLQFAAPQVDANGDGFVGTDELSARIERMQQQGATFTTLPCRVLLDGKPLAGTDVFLEPEGFFGAMAKSAKGRTARDGTTMFVTEGELRPGVYVGYYRIRLSRLDRQGNELLPPRFNASTQLGAEIGIGDSDDFDDGTLVLKLETK